MAPQKQEFPLIREAVASFRDRGSFEKAVGDLLAAGFRRSDISALASHQSLEAAETPGGEAFLDEIGYLGPLTIAGIIVLSGGPVAAGIAALVGAGLGGAAIKDLLDHFSSGHSDEFAAALDAGALLLWARVDDPELEPAAIRILEEAGGRHAHMHARQAPSPTS
ncbi:MAG TPA: hypothetical protein VGD08_06940 [Stellaceae bacterium]|jgi:hypothetical protein